MNSNGFGEPLTAPGAFTSRPAASRQRTLPWLFSHWLTPWRSTRSSARSLLVRRAQRRNPQILATDVERDADFVRIRESDYELFAGGSYSEHSADGETAVSADGKALLRLLVDASADLEVQAVSRRIQANPVLAEGLLRLVNALEVARAATIESVDQALIMIGTKDLSRWPNLLLFQMGSKSGFGGPLCRVAARAARR